MLIFVPSLLLVASDQLTVKERGYVHIPPPSCTVRWTAWHLLCTIPRQTAERLPAAGAFSGSRQPRGNSRNALRFKQPERSSPCSQKPTTDPMLSQINPVQEKSILILSIHGSPGLSRDVFTSFCVHVSFLTGWMVHPQLISRVNFYRNMSTNNVFSHYETNLLNLIA
jgi:hypothetical protein